MPDISLIALIGGVPTPGIVCSAYKASRFGALPVPYDTAAPGGAADATATSGNAYGGPGQVSLAVPTFEEYWIAIPSGGHIGWVKSPSPVVPESDVTSLLTDLAARTNPMTTQDDLIVGGAAGIMTRLAKGSDRQVLTVDPTTHHLGFDTPASGAGSGAKLWKQALSPGSPATGRTATVISDGKYNAFPQLTVNRQGKLFLVYREGVGHLTTDGKVTLQTSSDGGGTWSAKTYIESPASGHDFRDPGILCTQTGRLLISYYDYDGTNYLSMYTAHSDDDGGTWSAPAALNPYSHWNDNSGGLFQHSSGAILMPINGQDTGDTNWRAGVLISSDDGVTWSSRINVGPQNSNYTEEEFIELPDGSIRVYIRKDGADPQQPYTSNSTDAGLTWTTPTALGFNVWPGRLVPVLVPVGNELILIYRQTGTEHVAWRYSLDLGVTWSGESVLSTDIYVYASQAALGDHLIGAVYAHEVGGGGAANIEFLTWITGVPTVTGNQHGIDALTSLLAALAEQGAIIDLTTVGTLPVPGTMPSLLAARTGGDVTLGGTFAAVDTATDLTIAAAAGSVLEIAVSAIITTTVAATNGIDVATMVSGSPVNWVSSGTGIGGAEGETTWYTEADFGASALAATGSMKYVVQAGDISGGNVTLRAFAKAIGGGGTNKIKAIAGKPFRFSVVKLS